MIRRIEGLWERAGRGLALDLAVAGLLLGASAWPAPAAEIVGRVSISGADGAGVDMVRGTVVYFRPSSGEVVPLPPERGEIVMVKKAFEPRVLALPVGSTVGFPNQDPILHNVFSVSSGNGFDLGLYRQGEGEETTFGEAGVVRVFCNVHHAMVAHVVVLDTPHYTRIEPDGSFRLAGLPDGPGELTVWNDRSSPHTTLVQTGGTRPIEVALVADRPAVPRHANKLGKPYSRSRRSKAY